ncbi:hypothetical protein I862_01685 [endosymbiont of Acanthamoeba sp. UWC8]|uniref:outer membrane protein n=1 Tax=endosymbiont of Acanthamoeba sp. UWC8 TaxID=86106 RepID=UPI0004D12E23|nr:outer membrane beta-barrel protein [endosymbiont of Acanthamoeba sp. UWC8]AIF80900.1 hypothetical protein I862_01685 [endosymbiont of Acanthamoeba sp. UWC8]
MKKVFFLGLCLSLFAAQANADDWYGSISAIIGKNRDKDNITRKGEIKGVSLTSDGAEIGLGTYLTPDMRGELSLNYFVGKKGYFLKSQEATGHIKLKHESYSLLFNSYYDFNNHTMAVPYVMAGLGYANNKINIKYSEYEMSKTQTDQGKLFGSKKGLTWQLGAGIDMKAAEDLKIGIGYRFRDTNTSGKKLNQYHMVLANIKMDF